MKKFEVGTGHEFELSAEVIQEQRLTGREVTRSKLAIVTSTSCMVALLIAAIQGFVIDEFSALRSVWSFVAMPIGAIIAHYFGERQRNEENN
jgi:hypothetical protein